MKLNKRRFHNLIVKTIKELNPGILTNNVFDAIFLLFDMFRENLESRKYPPSYYLYGLTRDIFTHCESEFNQEIPDQIKNDILGILVKYAQEEHDNEKHKSLTKKDLQCKNSLVKRWRSR